jgi:hypothetical protein
MTSYGYTSNKTRIQYYTPSRVMLTATSCRQSIHKRTYRASDHLRKLFKGDFAIAILICFHNSLVHNLLLTTFKNDIPAVVVGL